MGASASKKVRRAMESSPEFGSACDSAYREAVSLGQHAFPGVLPYQLHGAASRLHFSLSSFPLVRNWIPSPPSQLQVDRALRRTRPNSIEEPLGLPDFKDFAVELFTDAAVSNAGAALTRRIPAGLAAIGATFLLAERIPGGVGAAVRSGRGLFGKAAGIYALGVAGAVYLSLSV
ncbi:uncharacterized protein LOC116249649 [Nymphaea colorata]|nr:uncharacterized protein LOC116249649 [Nymphaea colorata]